MRYIKEVLYLIGDDQIKLIGMIFLFLAVSLIDAIGLGLIVPYVSLILDPTIINDGLMKEFFEFSDFFYSSKNGFIVFMSLILVFIFLTKAVVGIWITKVIIYFSYKHQVRIRSQLMNSYQSIPYIDYIKRNSSEYIYSIHGLVGIFTGKILMTGLKTISDIFIAVAIISVLAWSDIKLLGILLILLGSLGLVYDRLIRKDIHVYGKAANIASTKMLKAVTEGITGMKEIRILGKAKFFYNAVLEQSNIYANNLRKTEVITYIPRYLFEFMVILFLSLMVIFELLVQGDIISLMPKLAVFGLATVKLVPAINSVSNGTIQLRFHRNSVSLLYEDLKKRKNLSIQTKITNNIPFNRFSLSSIRYKYPNANDYVLNDVSLEFKKGESIGVMGISGSGKTTLIDIILGLLEPQNGEIKLNGVNINMSMAAFQASVAYLPQQVFILDDTLKNNIILGSNVSEIDYQRLEKAIEQSMLKELLERLPKGLDTRLGEHGISFSGGQRQRVALARAIYHQKDILVMDEATSALDENTEKEVVEEIKKLKGISTMIIIAHRLETLKYCDRIYQLDKGRIVDVTTFEELTNKRKA